MKEQEKQIKELEKDLEEYVAYDEWSAKEYGKYTVDCSYTAYKLIEQGWIKPDKDSVVLSGLELAEYKHYKEYTKSLAMIEKETAERDFNAIIKALEERKDRVEAFYGVAESVGVDVAIKTVKELAKQFGIKIKE